jgi:hypothetical protein
MAQTVSRRPLIAKPRVQFKASPRGIYGEQIGTRTSFPPMLHTNLIIYNWQYSV